MRRSFLQGFLIVSILFIGLTGSLWGQPNVPTSAATNTPYPTDEILATGTVEASATPTATIEPTATPMPTSTQVNPTADDLLSDGDFEVAYLEQTAWRLAGRGKGQIICDTARSMVRRSLEGNCALKLHGVKLTQKVTALELLPGTTLRLNAYVRAKNLPQHAARLRLRVTYADGTFDTTTLSLAPGTYEYQPTTNQLTLSQTPVSIQVALTHRGGGKLFVDNVSLTAGAEEATPGDIPLPSQ